MAQFKTPKFKVLPLSELQNKITLLEKGELEKHHVTETAGLPLDRRDQYTLLKNFISIVTKLDLTEAAKSTYITGAVLHIFDFIDDSYNKKWYSFLMTLFVTPKNSYTHENIMPTVGVSDENPLDPKEKNQFTKQYLMLLSALSHGIESEELKKGVSEYHLPMIESNYFNDMPLKKLQLKINQEIMKPHTLRHIDLPEKNTKAILKRFKEEEAIINQSKQLAVIPPTLLELHQRNTEATLRRYLVEEEKQKESEMLQIVPTSSFENIAHELQNKFSPSNEKNLASSKTPEVMSKMIETLSSDEPKQDVKPSNQPIASDNKNNTDAIENYKIEVLQRKRRKDEKPLETHTLYVKVVNENTIKCYAKPMKKTFDLTKEELGIDSISIDTILNHSQALLSNQKVQQNINDAIKKQRELRNKSADITSITKTAIYKQPVKETPNVAKDGEKKHVRFAI